MTDPEGVALLILMMLGTLAALLIALVIESRMTRRKPMATDVVAARRRATDQRGYQVRMGSRVL